MTEIWKDIPGYEGLYQVSNFGRLKSISRFVKNRYSGFYTKEKILKPAVDSTGYNSVSFSINGVLKTFRVHQLVAMAFLNHVPNGFKLVCNHIDFNKTNNRLDNLEIVTNRINSNHKHLPSKTSYPAVFVDNRFKKQKWSARPVINKSKVYLGRFDTEFEAHVACETAICNYDNNRPIEIKKAKFSSKYEGVSWSKKANKWSAYIVSNRKAKWIGYFASEDSANNARQSELIKLKNEEFNNTKNSNKKMC